ncbi:MAG TPA: prolyl aminopeptidase, partial [Gammaproteobacteria bacterium]|nr:prolyl aminopeptidase [Gammaproteobacteria bacterium]
DPETGAIPRAGLLSGLPGAIVQGRLDLVCPVAEATAIARRWPEAELRVVEDAAHVDSDPGIEAALIDVMRNLTGRLHG